MLKVELDKSKKLLRVVLSQRVTAEETGRWREQISQFSPGVEPGFKCLIDFSALESMDLDCMPDIAWSMERLDNAGVSKIVRIIPDPHKDIGLNIMSLFHFRRQVSFVTCETMEEALDALAV
jgi:hypothetical protein